MFISKGGTLRNECVLCLLNYVLSQLGQILIRFCNMYLMPQNVTKIYTNSTVIMSE